MNFNEMIGKKVTYISGSGQRYEATVFAIPEKPEHGYSPLPTVSLEFRDERGKLVRKERVIPACSTFARRVYEI